MRFRFRSAYLLAFATVVACEQTALDPTKARHIAVAPNGDIFVAIQSEGGGVLALRDTDGEDGLPSHEPELFADGFIGEDAVNLPDDADHRPVGLAEGPDGSLYITDDEGGRIWRVLHASRR